MGNQESHTDQSSDEEEENKEEENSKEENNEEETNEEETKEEETKEQEKKEEEVKYYLPFYDEKRIYTDSHDFEVLDFDVDSNGMHTAILWDKPQRRWYQVNGWPPRDCVYDWIPE